MWWLTLRDRRSAGVLAAVVLPLLLGATLMRSGADAPAPLPRVEPVAAAQPTSLPDGGALPDDEALPDDGVLPDGEVLRLHSAGRDRAVLVQDPLDGRPARALLMLLGPHALTVARSAADLRVDTLRAQGWAVAYPSTVDGDWNAGRCCGSPQRLGVDDVRFLQDVRGLLQQRYGVGDGAVALAGYSTGGQMAYRVICEHPGFARALLVVAGSLETSCTPTAPLPPTLVVHGTADSTVPWETSDRPVPLLDFTPTPLLTSFATYSAAAGCSGARVDERDGRHLVGWGACDRAPSVVLAGMPGAGHGWEDLRASVYAERFLPDALGLDPA